VKSYTEFVESIEFIEFPHLYYTVEVRSLLIDKQLMTIDNEDIGCKTSDV